MPSLRACSAATFWVDALADTGRNGVAVLKPAVFASAVQLIGMRSLGSSFNSAAAAMPISSP